MRKYFFKVLVLPALILFCTSTVFSQSSDSGRFDVINKNAFRFGVNQAKNGSGDYTSLSYQTEYQRTLNTYFDIGAGLGFFRIAKTTNFLGFNETDMYTNQSVVFADILTYLKILDSKRHFLKLGVGLSVRSSETLSFGNSSYVTNIDGSILDSFDVSYVQSSGIEATSVFHLEYGFKLTPNIYSSLNGRLYAEGKYTSFFMYGLSFYYSF